MTREANYTTPGNHNLKTPSREDFHRYYPNNITLSDFDTTSPTGNQVMKVDNAIYKTLTNKNKRNFAWA